MYPHALPATGSTQGFRLSDALHIYIYSWPALGLLLSVLATSYQLPVPLSLSAASAVSCRCCLSPPPLLPLPSLHRNSSSTLANAAESLKPWPQPSNRCSRAPGMRSASRRAFSGGTNTSRLPLVMRQGAVMPGSADHTCSSPARKAWSALNCRQECGVTGGRDVDATVSGVAGTEIDLSCRYLTMFVSACCSFVQPMAWPISHRPVVHLCLVFTHFRPTCPSDLLLCTLLADLCINDRLWHGEHFLNVLCTGAPKICGTVSSSRFDMWGHCVGHYEREHSHGTWHAVGAHHTTHTMQAGHSFTSLSRPCHAQF